MSELHPHNEDHPAIVSRAARRGLILFLVYFALYAGFLLLNVLNPSAMQETAVPLQRVPPGRDALDVVHIDLHGLNLALVYGLFLILAAVLLAFLYMRLTRTPRS